MNYTGRVCYRACPKDRVHRKKKGKPKTFLHEKAQYRKRFSEEVIRAALDAMNEAKDTISRLETER